MIIALDVQQEWTSKNAKYNASKAVDWEERLLMPVSITKIIAQTMVTFVIFALALFIPAGTVAWQAGWIFLGMFFRVVYRRQYVAVQA